MEGSHDGSDRDHRSPSPPPPAGREERPRDKPPLVLRPFAWKHDQDPADAARLGDFNLAMRSGDRTASAAAAHDGGRQSKSAAAASMGADLGGGVSATPPAAKPMRLVVTCKKRMKEEAAEGEEADGAAIPSPPAGTAGQADDDRKKAHRRHHVPCASGGDQGTGSSPSPSRKPVSTSKHRSKAAVEADIDDDEAMFKLGLEVALTMSPAELKAAVDKYLGVEDLPRSQRVAAMQRRGDADRPPFDFRLTKEQAMADVMAVLNHKKRRKD
ncbi:hypothetical protein ACP70R_047273 [Stipagrostis hirtigluma subsp. patula]